MTRGIPLSKLRAAAPCCQDLLAIDEGEHHYRCKPCGTWWWYDAKPIKDSQPQGLTVSWVLLEPVVKKVFAIEDVRHPVAPPPAITRSVPMPTRGRYSVIEEPLPKYDWLSSLTVGASFILDESTPEGRSQRVKTYAQARARGITLVARPCEGAESPMIRRVWRVR